MSNTVKNGHPLRIVIIGANFAGLTAAINLSRDFSVTVIDCRPQFEFLPNIHELLSGVKKPASLRMDRKRLIGRAGHRFIKDTVTTIDPTKKKVYTSGRKRMPFDICVVAVGGVNNTSGIAGPLFAGAKEGIFQATMTKLDPPRGLTSAINLYNRTSEGLFNLAIPTLTSFSSLRRLANFRFLS